MAKESTNYLKIYFDGGSRGNPGPSAVGAVVYDDKGKILEELSITNNRFSDLVKPYKKYVHSGEINSKVKDKEQTIKQVISANQDAKKIDYLDGITIEYDDYWFNIRPSNTEPLLRLNLEAKNKQIMEKQKEKLLAIIRS